MTVFSKLVLNYSCLPPFFNLQLYGRGDYQLEIYDQHHGWVEHEIHGNENSFSWQKISWGASREIGYFRYRVRLSNEDSLFCKLRGPDNNPFE